MFKKFNILATLALIGLAWPAQASLIGDQINGALTKPNFPGLQIFNPTSATVSDPGVEFSGTAVFSSIHNVHIGAFADFTGDEVTIGFEAINPGNISDPGSSVDAVHYIFSFTDVEWVGMAGQITGLTFLEATPLYAFGSDPGWFGRDPANFVINTTANSFSIGTGGWVFPGPPPITGDTIFARFRIDATHIPPPTVSEPGALALFGLGLLGLGAVRRRAGPNCRDSLHFWLTHRPAIDANPLISKETVNLARSLHS